MHVHNSSAPSPSILPQEGPTQSIKGLSPLSAIPKILFLGKFKTKPSSCITQQRWLRLSAWKEQRQKSTLQAGEEQQPRKMNPASSEKMSHCDMANGALSCTGCAMHEESRSHLAAIPPPARAGQSRCHAGPGHNTSPGEAATPPAQRWEVTNPAWGGHRAQNCSWE